MKGNQHLHKYLMWLLTASLLAACSWMPSPTQQTPQSQIQADVLTTAGGSTGSVPGSSQPQAKQPEKITFPSMVKTSVLAEGSLDEIVQLKALLPEEFKVAQANAQVHVAEFKSKKANGKSQILIPENGSFNLVLESGNQYAIVDDNATDGQAKITIPAGSLESWVHLQGPWSTNSALALEDALYYVKDSLNNKQGNVANADRWFKLGVRPLPVPSDWYSPDGNQFILKLKTTDVKDFQMVWKRVGGDAPYPPGINKIGAEGGFLELPGVAKMVIAKEAVSTPTVFSIREILSFYTPLQMGFIDYTYVGPVISIKPEVTLNRKYLSMVWLTLNMDLVKDIDPVSLRYVFLNPTNFMQNKLMGQIASATTYPTLKNPFDLEKTGIISAITPDTEIESSKIHPYRPDDFQINAVPNPNPTPNWLGGNFHVSARFPSSERKEIFEAAERTWIPFATIQTGQMPLKTHYETLYKDETTCEQAKLIDPRAGTYSDACQLIQYGPFVEVRAITGSGGPATRINSLIQNAYHIEQPIGTSFQVDSLYHEIYHVFQFANLDPSKYLTIFTRYDGTPIVNSIPTIDRNLLITDETRAANRGWIYESSARYMGAKLYYDHYFLYHPTFSQTQRLKNIYSSPSTYGPSFEGLAILFAGQTNATWDENKRSLFSFPYGENFEDDTTPKYGRTGLFAILGQEHGPQFISELCHKYSSNGLNGFSLENAVNALDDTLNTKNSSLSKKYIDYALDYFFKDFGLGTSQKEFDLKTMNYINWTPQEASDHVNLIQSGSPVYREMDILASDRYDFFSQFDHGTETAPWVIERTISNTKSDVHEVLISMDKDHTQGLGRDNSNFRYFANQKLVVRLDLAQIIESGGQIRKNDPEMLKDSIKLVARNFFRKEKAFKRNVKGFTAYPSSTEAKLEDSPKNILQTSTQELGKMKPESIILSDEDYFPFYVFVAPSFPELGPEAKIKYRLKIYTIEEPQLYNLRSGPDEQNGLPTPLIPGGQYASNATLDDKDERTQIQVVGAGFEEGNSWLIYEPLNQENPIEAQATVEYAKDAQGNTITDDEGRELQIITAYLPNHAKREGRLYGKSNKLTSNNLDRANVCNMLATNTNFQTANVKPCQQKVK